MGILIKTHAQHPQRRHRPVSPHLFAPHSSSSSPPPPPFISWIAVLCWATNKKKNGVSARLSGIIKITHLQHKIPQRPSILRHSHCFFFFFCCFRVECLRRKDMDWMVAECWCPVSCSREDHLPLVLLPLPLEMRHPSPLYWQEINISVTWETIQGKYSQCLSDCGPEARHQHLLDKCCRGRLDKYPSVKNWDYFFREKWRHFAEIWNDLNTS